MKNIYSKNLVKISMIAAIFLFIFSLSAVSAAESDYYMNSTDTISNGIASTDPGRTLYLEAGNYTLDSYDIIINKNITIQGNGPTKDVVINAENKGRMFKIEKGVKVTFINITFINANTRSNGGVIYNTGGDITLKNTVFSDNAAWKGGAIYSESGTINIDNSVFDKNHAINHTEAKIYSGAIHQESGYMTITNSNFTNNTASQYSGAIRIVAGTLKIENCNFIENYAGSCGGALYVYGGDVTIDNTNFTKNIANDGGGAIYLTKDGILKITNSNFEENKAGSWGGGAIRKDNSSTRSLTIENSNFIDNDAAIGGAISAKSNVTITGSNFLNNKGISLYLMGDNIIINYNRIVDNVSQYALVFDDEANTTRPDINYNWWGEDTYNSNISPDNYYVASLTNTTSTNAKLVGDTISLKYSLVLNGTNDNTGIYKLPDFKASLNYDGLIILIDGRSDNFMIQLKDNSNNFSIKTDDALTTLTVSAATRQIIPPTKNKTILTISAPTIYEGKKTTIKTTLKDSNGKVLKGEKISITINKKTYTKTTDSKGIATFQVAGLKGGKFAVSGKYNGNTNYNSSIASNTQIVKAKVDLAIVKVKKIKTRNKKIAKYQVVIQNKGSLKSKATTLKSWHVRNGKKIKAKSVKVKAIASGKKTILIVTHSPDKTFHKYCKAYFQVNPKKAMNEISYKNNLKVIG